MLAEVEDLVTENWRDQTFSLTVATMSAHVPTIDDEILDRWLPAKAIIGADDERQTS